MKKLIFAFLLLPIVSYAQSFLISEIPPPKVYVQDLDTYECDQYCMQMYLDNGMIFSFLSHATSKLQDEKQEQVRTMSITLLNLGTSVDFSVKQTLRIALLLPYKKIGKYATSTTNAVMAYLMAKNQFFELKTYKIESESYEDIQNALTLIKEDRFAYVIAPLTQDGVKAVTSINPKINIYFPTVNKNNSITKSEYLFYGGIDYKAQSDLLIKEAVSPLVIFYDKSALGKTLALIEEDEFKYIDNLQNSTIGSYAQHSRRVLDRNKKVIKYSIPPTTTNLKHYLDKNERIQKASFFINTPIIKTGMIMSQLTLYDANATNVLSTQINYDPLLLSMTQYNDRKEMIIANSITEDKNILIEANSLVGNDIVYDWINYTTTVGIDYFYNLVTQRPREYKIDVEDNQMKYHIELLKPTRYSFKSYTSKYENFTE